MTIVKKLSVSILGLAFLVGMGCDQRPAYTQNVANADKGLVAVIDLDKVAKALNWTDELTRDQAEADKELSNRLNKFGEELRAAYAAEEKKITPTSTDEQKQKLAQMKAALDDQFRNEFTKAQQMSNQNRVTLVVKYRDRIAPVARRVANSKGMSIVMVKNDAILTYDDKNEITNDVIDELQKSGAAAKPAPATPAPAATTPAPKTP